MHRGNRSKSEVENAGVGMSSSWPRFLRSGQVDPSAECLGVEWRRLEDEIPRGSLSGIGTEALEISDRLG